MFYSSNAASKWCCLNGFPCTFEKYLFRVCLINARFPLTAACQPPSFWSIFLCISLLFTVLFLCFKATCVFQEMLCHYQREWQQTDFEMNSLHSGIAELVVKNFIINFISSNGYLKPFILANIS